MSWTVHMDAPVESVGQDPEALTMEIDPRTRVIRLGLRPLGATSQEIDSGTILRRHLSATQAAWAPVREWILGPEAASLLAAIEAGYASEQLWSGDWQAQWSESAWAAATALHQGVDTQLSAQGPPPPMRISHVQAHALAGLSDREPAGTWMLRLSRSGLLLPDEPAPPQSPQAEMDVLYQAAMALCDLEDEIAQSRYGAKRLYLAPRYAPLWVLGVWILSMFCASGADDYIERLKRFGWFWAVLSGIAIAVLFGIQRGARGREKSRQERFSEAKALAASTREEVLRSRDKLMGRTFAAVVKDRLVVHTPDLTWLDECLRETPGEASALREELLEAQSQIRAQVEHLARNPPASWTAEKLTADTASLIAAMQAANFARIPPPPQRTG